MHIEGKVTDGIFLISTFGFGGVHGATIIGVQGIGAPNAAATAGLAGDVHMAKGNMFTNGLKSVISITVIFSEFTIFAGNTIILPGAKPKEHFAIVVIHGVGDGILFVSTLLYALIVPKISRFFYITGIV